MFEEALEAARDSDVRLQSGDASLIRPLGAFVVVIANTVDVLACHLLMLPPRAFLNQNPVQRDCQ